MDIVLIALILMFAVLRIFKMWITHRTRVRIAQIDQETQVMVIAHNARSLALIKSIAARG